MVAVFYGLFWPSNNCTRWITITKQSELFNESQEIYMISSRRYFGGDYNQKIIILIS
jgi:hypothetical protein